MSKEPIGTDQDFGRGAAALWLAVSGLAATKFSLVAAAIETLTEGKNIGETRATTTVGRSMRIEAASTALEDRALAHQRGHGGPWCRQLDRPSVSLGRWSVNCDYGRQGGVLNRRHRQRGRSRPRQPQVIRPAPDHMHRHTSTSGECRYRCWALFVIHDVSPAQYEDTEIVRVDLTTYAVTFGPL